MEAGAAGTGPAGSGGGAGTTGAAGISGAAGSTGCVNAAPSRPDGGLDGGDAGPSEIAAACEACQRAHAEHDRCPPLLLTATYTEDPSSGDHLPVGWGLSTLPTQAQRDAAAALLRCLDANLCATDEKNVCPGDNPALGCFCGAGVTVEACIGGDGVHGPCLAAYAAAAAATPGGPPAGASLAAVSLFVSMHAYDPQTPVGLANMVHRCAVAAGCDVCLGL